METARESQGDQREREKRRRREREREKERNNATKREFSFFSLSLLLSLLLLLSLSLSHTHTHTQTYTHRHTRTSASPTLFEQTALCIVPTYLCLRSSSPPFLSFFLFPFRALSLSCDCSAGEPRSVFLPCAPCTASAMRASARKARMVPSSRYLKQEKAARLQSTHTHTRTHTRAHTHTESTRRKRRTDAVERRGGERRRGAG